MNAVCRHFIGKGEKEGEISPATHTGFAYFLLITPPARVR
jgi:hypothetical protein